jgi:hypothetical protein
MANYPIIDATVLIKENGVTLFSGGLIQIQVDRWDMGSPLQSYHCTAQDWSAICDRRIVNATYLAGEDVSFVFQDILSNVLGNPNEGISGNHIAPSGTDNLDANEVFNFVTVTQAFDQLCTDQGWIWWIDVNADLHALPVPDILTAPFSLSETSKNFRALYAQATLVDYRNVQYVVSNLAAVPGVAVQQNSQGVNPGEPGFGQPVVTETYTLPQAAAAARGFLLGSIITNFPILQITSLTVNGVSQPVQLGEGNHYNLQKSWWYFPGFPFLYPPNVNNNTPSFPYPPVTSPYPTSGQTVVISYVAVGSSQGAVLRSGGNPLTPSTPGSAGNWGSGVFENVQQVKNINIQSDLNAVADALLNRSDFVPTQIQFETDIPGAQVGMKVPINLPPSFVPSTDSFMITAIKGDLQTGVLEAGSAFKWTITCTTGNDIGNSTKWFERLIARTQNPVPLQQPDRQTWILSPGGSVSSASATANPIVLQSGGVLVVAYAIAGTPPTNQQLVIDILDNGVSILGPGNQIIIGSGVVDPVYVRTFAKATVNIGDVLSLSVEYQGTGGSPLPASSVTVYVGWGGAALPADQSQPGVYQSYVTGQLNVVTQTLPNATDGAGYAATLAAAGGTPPYSWSATGVPAGLTLDASGNLAGTPSVSGSFSIRVTVTDSSFPQLTSTRGLTLLVNP